MINCTHLDNCTLPFSLLFKTETVNTKHTVGDIQEALIMAEEVVSEVIGGELVTDELIKRVLDVCANAFVFHFDLSDDLDNVEIRTVMQSLKCMLEGHINTEGQLDTPHLWSYLRDLVEHEYHKAQPYTDSLDLRIATQTLESKIPQSLNEFCILHPNHA